HLRYAVEHERGLNTDRFEDRRNDVDDMLELRAEFATALDAIWPPDRHSIACSAEVRCNLFRPLEGRVHRVCPTHWIVIVRLVASQFVHHREKEGQRLRLGRHLSQLAGYTLQRTFGARAVVALNVDNERVVELARLLEAVDNATDLIVALGNCGRINLHHPCVDFLLVRVERIPRRDAIRARRENRVGWYDAKTLLSCERLLP